MPGEVLTCGGLFDGVGLLAYGLHLAGWEHSWLCEWDPWRRSILEQRWPGIPVYPDVRAVGAATAGPVRLIAGGFPCKGASSAGKRNGFGHPETVLWREQIRCIRELRPEYVLVENVADLLHVQGGECFGEVLGDLASSGYDCWWDVLPAASFGAPHLRQRVFVIAHATGGSEGRNHAVAANGLAAEPHGSGRPTPADSTIVTEREPADEAHPVAGGRNARPEPRSGGLRAVADSGEGGREGQPPEHREEPQEPTPHAERSGLPVEWAQYAGAVERWGTIIGRTAPEPLIRGVDDGATRRMDKPRLSALGDGVLVQAGWLVGRMIVEHATTREAQAA